MEEKILSILQTIDDEVDFQKETALVDDEILDSFAIIQLVSELMDQFGIDIDVDDLEPENLNSLENICELVRKKQMHK